MPYIDQDKKLHMEESFQDRFLKRLYGSILGRGILHFLVRPSFSRWGGKILSTSLSKIFIPPFVRKHGIDLSICEKESFSSYNDFFTRKLREGARSFSPAEKDFCAPCDSKLTVCQVDEGTNFWIKNTPYTLHRLLRDYDLAEKYAGGQMCIFRLSVEDYHRYAYVDGGIKTRNRRIHGLFHTVNPIANDVYPIYKENEREYSLLRSDHFKDILMMEVGALMVGKIVNHHEKTRVVRGEEKGYFEFGGSTVILLLEKDAVKIREDILVNSLREYETQVKMGEIIGEGL